MGLSDPAHQRFSWWRMHHSLHWCHWWLWRAHIFHQVHWKGLLLYKAKKFKSYFMFFPDSAMIFHSQVLLGEVFIIFPSACGVSENESLEISQNLSKSVGLSWSLTLSNTFQVDFLASPSFHHCTLHLGGFAWQTACHLALALDVAWDLGDLRGNSLLVPDETLEHPCTAKGPEVMVPVTWWHRGISWMDFHCEGLELSNRPRGTFIKDP